MAQKCLAGPVRFDKVDHLDRWVFRAPRLYRVEEVGPLGGFEGIPVDQVRKPETARGAARRPRINGIQRDAQSGCQFESGPERGCAGSLSIDAQNDWLVRRRG